MVTNQVQTGSYSVVTGSDLVINIAITSVVVSATMVQYSLRTAHNGRFNKSGFRIELTSSTNLRFTRIENNFDQPQTIEWVVTEFASGVASIQTGSINASATPTNVAITSVDTTKSFPLAWASSNIAAGYTTSTCWEMKITTATNLQFQWSVAPATDGCFLSWQVVSFTTGISVQAGETGYMNNNSTCATNITSVNTAKTLVYSTRQINYGSNPLSRTGIRTLLTNATTITFSNIESAGTPGLLTNEKCYGLWKRGWIG